MQVDTNDDLEPPATPSEGLLILCYIHGFKGNSETFEEYPKRIQYSLSQTYEGKLQIHSEVYPAYKTAGKLVDAVALFNEWLVALVAEKEQAFMLQHDKTSGQTTPWQERKQARIILLAHSMGGLVAADCVLSILKDYETAEVALWPKIIGILAFDTPYIGLNPRTFSNTADQYIDHATKAHDTIKELTGYSIGSLLGGKAAANSSAGQAISRETSANASSSWWNSKTVGALGGTALAAAAAGLAWSQRSAISSLGVNSWDFVNGHLEFVRALWKQEDLSKRLSAIVDLENPEKGSAQPPIGFHCIFTQVPSAGKYTDRTFIVLPVVDKNSPATKRQRLVRQRFTANTNTNAANEVDAHVSMFNVKNDGQHDMALLTVKLISEWITRT